jgi:hypothetical protein
VTEYEDCGHGKHKGAYCHPCEMEKILDLESDYGIGRPKIIDCEHGIRIDRPCYMCDGLERQVGGDWVETMPSAKQIGGNHYRDMKIQPGYFSYVNGLNNCQSEAINYICRYEKKGGKQDLEKAKHYIDLLIEWRYGNDVKSAEEKEG